MKRLASSVVGWWPVLVLAACGDGGGSGDTRDGNAPEVEVDAGDTHVGGDTDVEVDTAVEGDTGVEGDAADVDAEVGDIGGDDAGPDAQGDVGDDVHNVDDVDDVGDVGRDAGDVGGDVGDVGDVGGGEVTPPRGDNIFMDGSFERWDAGLPVGWYGEASNIATSDVHEDTREGHDGVRACGLVNTGSTHKRFSSAPLAVRAGRYTCSYWARGGGEIRTARYDGDYSSYTSYTTIASPEWQEVVTSFNVAADTPAFELVFSVRNTDPVAGHLSIDDVVCTRAVEACDVVTCEGWQVCDAVTASCVTGPGYCADGGDCEAWQACNAEHRCELAPGFCEGTIDCGGATPVCDLASHTCVAGDPCAGVTCDAWEVCDPATSNCVVAAGRCEGLGDCADAGEGPVCDKATKTCVGIDHAANVVPNGGFEAWSEVSFGGTSTFVLPDAWYGVDDGSGAYYPDTELRASDVRRYTSWTHGGEAACQLVDPVAPAERFTTEPFAVTSGASYECAYWVRGQGTFRQRAYCAAWGPDTEFTTLDSDTWQQVRFELSSNANWCVLIFYASNTVAASDHLQLDDVVCVRK